jgi:hypothetical protein
MCLGVTSLAKGGKAKKIPPQQMGLKRDETLPKGGNAPKRKTLKQRTHRSTSTLWAIGNAFILLESRAHPPEFRMMPIPFFRKMPDV